MNQDQIKGRMDQAKGKIKQVTGKLLGDDELATEGKVNQAVGKVQANLGDLKEKAKNGYQSLVK